jgi:hypothetical protein
MWFKCAAISKTDKSNFESGCDNFKPSGTPISMQQWRMVWDVLNNENISASQINHYKEELMRIACISFNINTANKNKSVAEMNSIYGPWRQSDYFNVREHPGANANAWNSDPSECYEAKYSGMDFLFYYNLFRLCFPSAVLPLKKTNDCACNSSGHFYTDDANTHMSNLATLKTDIPFRFPEYKNFKIPIPEWLTQSLTVNSGGELKPEGDLFVCNSTLKIQNGGKLSTSTNTNNSYYKIIQINKTAELWLENGSTLTVENNTETVIAPEGKLKYFAGAHIVLNGPNAILHIKGKLELAAGAIFQIEGGSNGKGYVIWDNEWGDASKGRCAELIAGTGSKILFENLSSNGYDRYLALEVRGDWGFKTGATLAELKMQNCRINIDEGSRIVSECENIRFNNVDVFGDKGQSVRPEYNYKLS